MRIIIELRHPAHLHHFKFLIFHLSKNHNIKILISKKDILHKLLDELSLSYIAIGENKNGVFKKTVEIIKQDINFLKEIKRFKPDIIIGRPSHPLLFISWIMRKRSIIFAEDDFNVIFFNALIAFPFAKFIIAPIVTDLGWFNKKKIGYNGYQKLSYLHPNYFTPQIDAIIPYIKIDKPYFLIRLSKLNASHDINIKGITDSLCKEIINHLEIKGNVYISSEREICKTLQKYIISIPYHLIHQVLYFADLFICDSQSMAMEAALLGTPSIRFSDLAGRLNVLEELECQYQLTFGINASNPDRLFQKINELLEIPKLKQLFHKRRQKMLDDKLDVNAFMIWFIENFPESYSIMKKNPDYQWRFK